LRAPRSPGVPAQLLLEPPRPEDPEPDLAASQSDGLTNRRMRARMSGGVGGGGPTPPPTRSLSLRKHSGQKPRARQRAWPGYGAIPCMAWAVTQIPAAAGQRRRRAISQGHERSTTATAGHQTRLLNSFICHDLSNSQADRPDFPCARCVPDETANHGHWQSLADTSACLSTCARAGPWL
jgi:hypothetical protein